MRRKLADKKRLFGSVYVDVHHENGATERIEQGNMIVNGGRDLFAAIIAQDSVSFPSYVAIGTGSTAVVATDTALGTEVDRNLIASTTSASGVITYKAFFSKSEANGSTIAEVGLFNASSGPTMVARTVLASTIAKTSSISLTITWTITLADS